MFYNKDDFFAWVFDETNPIRSLFLEYANGKIELKDWFYWGITGVILVFFMLLLVKIGIFEEDKHQKPKEQVIINGTSQSVIEEGYLGIFFLVILGIIFFIIPPYVVKGIMLNDMDSWKKESPRYLEEYLKKEDFSNEENAYFNLELLNSMLNESGLFLYCDNNTKHIGCIESSRNLYQKKYIEAFKVLKKEVDENRGDSYDAYYISKIYKSSPFIKADEVKAQKYELIRNKLKQERLQIEEKQKKIEEEKKKKEKQEIESKKVAI